jgi:hypothetical protein
MTSKPLFLSIVSNRIASDLFIIGGNELFIVSLPSCSVKISYPLGPDLIHAVEPGFSVDQPGLYVYLWSESRGYKKRFFNSTQATDDNWWFSLTTAITEKKTIRSLANSTLKVVLPEILGLVILPGLEEVGLINLGTMQMVKQCQCKLSGWRVHKPHKTIVQSYHLG